MRMLVAGEPVGAVLRRTGGGNIEADGLDLDERWLHLNELRRHGNTGVGGGVSTGVDHNQLGGDGDTGGTLTEEARPALGSAKSTAPRWMCGHDWCRVRAPLAICRCHLHTLCALSNACWHSQQTTPIPAEWHTRGVRQSLKPHD